MTVKPIETTYGLHISKVLETTTPNAGHRVQIERRMTPDANRCCFDDIGFMAPFATGDQAAASRKPFRFARPF
jgi:hypothetical protein